MQNSFEYRKKDIKLIFFIDFKKSRGKNLKFATPETTGRLGTSFWRLDFWDRLGNQYKL